MISKKETESNERERAIQMTEGVRVTGVKAAA